MERKTASNFVKKLLSVALTLVMIFGVGTTVGNTVINPIGVVASAAKVALSATSVKLVVGKTKTLKVKNTSKKVSWSSKNKKVATVSSKGVVTAKGVGTTYIYAKVGGKTYKCKVTVVKVEISATSKSLYYKDTTTLKMKNTTSKVTWSSGDKKVATVSSSGKVAAKGLGSTYIYAKVGGKTYKCKVTVKDRNQSAKSSIKVNDGGNFVKGESTVKVSVKMPKYDAAKAYVYIQDASGETVYKKTLSALTKNKTVSFNWNGKDSSGKYVSGGSYRALVKVGTTKAYSSYIKFIAKNDFAGGNGSKSNPFEVASIAQLKKIIKYPTAYFKQTKDLDFDYEALGGLFSEDQPFSGVYDGNNKTIANIAATEALFESVGKNATIKNVVMKGCSVVGDGQALLAKNNYGKITACDINGTVSASGDGNNYNAGLMVCYNYGTISNCETSGNIATNCRNFCYAGGIAEYNGQSGKIIACVSHTNVTVNTANDESYAGGIVATNDGMINGCEADGTIVTTSYYDTCPGGIASTNNSQIIGSYYTGPSTVNICYKNTGTIA